MQHYKNKILNLVNVFKIPLVVLLGILISLILKYYFNSYFSSSLILIAVVFVGSLELIRDTLRSLFKGKFALDYIALLAITIGLLTKQHLVSGIIVLMLSGGNTLENYATRQAKESLTALTDRIPNEIYLWKKGHIGEKMPISNVKVGQEIAIRKGEVVPLDGVLVSKAGLMDESSLTGESYIIDKIEDDQIRSGTINVGNLIVVRVLKSEEDSTYKQIVRMVQEAQNEKAPLIRIADRYSTIFTIVTLILAGAAYLISRDMIRVLSVFVIATPCPLILATPIALMGGMNSAAKKRIIIKHLSSLEVLSRIDTLIFDKTGTITLGRPQVKRVQMLDRSYTRSQIFAIAEAIERNSLHPLAKAIATQAKKEKDRTLRADLVEETVGSGIKAVVGGKKYFLSKVKNYQGMAIRISENSKDIAIFEFEDEIKRGSNTIMKKFIKSGMKLLIFTGDRKDVAEKLLRTLNLDMEIKAGCSPEEKKEGVKILKKEGKTIGMVGDGINDAPALALADVGMVFSNEEHTAASEAADVVFLGGDFIAVSQAVNISKKTISIALQSIFVGIGLSSLGMVFAVFGFIPAVLGAFFQEAIDISVIFNSLRASK